MTRTLLQSPRLDNLRRDVSFAAFATAAVVYFLSMTSFASADQVIITNDPASPVAIGENVECSTCDLATTASAIELLTNGSGGEVTAGQLWRFFKAQGVDSMDELMLQLDIDPNQVAADGTGSSLDISSLQFQIENPGGDSCCTDVNIGDKQFLMPSLDGVDGAAGMQLAVKLQYDFMERFSADSQEKVSLNMSTPGMLPSISIAPRGSMLISMNWPVLFGFTLFWGVAFAVVNWFTKPQLAGPANASIGSVNHGSAAPL